MYEVFRTFFELPCDIFIRLYMFENSTRSLTPVELTKIAEVDTFKPIIEKLSWGRLYVTDNVDNWSFYRIH